MILRYLLLFSASVFIQFSIYCQDFQYHSTDPFGIQLTNEEGSNITYKLLFADRDLDGDQDVFLISFGFVDPGELNVNNFIYFIDYQENIGTPENPVFGPKEAAFEEFQIPDGYFFPACGDLNGDDQLDFIAMGRIEEVSEIQHLVFYMSSPNGFDITVDTVHNLNSIAPLSTMIPTLTDLDADGDLDIMMSGVLTKIFVDTLSSANVLYAKNIGTITDPEFLGWFYNPYEILKDTLQEIIKAIDIDADGDMDAASLVNIDSVLTLMVKENISSDIHRPVFSDGEFDRYGLPVAEEDQFFLDFNFTDLDGDGDLDLFLIEIGDELRLLYYENAQCISILEEITENICEGEFYEGYSTTGIYIDTFPVSEGCDSIRTLALNVLPIYDEYIEESGCYGDTIWLGNEVISSSGSYMVTLQSISGCDSVVLADVNIEVVDTQVMSDNNILQVMSGYASYQWIDCETGEDIPGEIGITFAPETSGSYAARITSSSGCEAFTQCVNLIISNTKEVGLATKLRLFPNPTNRMFHIENKTGKKIDDITVVDFSGKVWMRLLDHNTPVVDLASLNPGGYLIRFQIGSELVVKKMIVH